MDMQWQKVSDHYYICLLELMGCTCSIYKQVEDKNIDKAPPQISNSMFIVQGLIGVGGFGEVLAVILQQTGKWYALKVINKVRWYSANISSVLFFTDCYISYALGQSIEAQKRAFYDFWWIRCSLTDWAASIYCVTARCLPRQVLTIL